MTSFAHVFGPSRLSRISAAAALFLPGSKASGIKAFDEMGEALAWLKSRSNLKEKI